VRYFSTSYDNPLTLPSVHHQHVSRRFGELALHSDNAVRAASVVAIEEVELLVLEKHDFQRILAKSVDHEANEKFRFVSDLPFFLNSSTREIQRLSAIMTKKTFEAKKRTCTCLSFLCLSGFRDIVYLDHYHTTVQ
jgi:hypothetical protein